MMEIQGRYNTAKVFVTELDKETENQIQHLVDNPFIEKSKVRIMPDCHAGKGCVIGTTMTIQDKIVPNLVGVDIGCGMLTVSLGKKEISLKDLDDFINGNIPSGFRIRDKAVKTNIKLEDLVCYNSLKDKRDYFYYSLGTLGGGNHFIEIDRDEEGNQYLIIHSGSRNLGQCVANLYQKIAIQSLEENVLNQQNIQAMVEKLKEEGKQADIGIYLSKVKKEAKKQISLIDKELAYLEGEKMKHYLQDMKLCQEFAVENRENMARDILSFLGLDFDSLEHYQTIHNYIDFRDNILRKGAVSCYKGEKITIPINMKDGTLFAIGKGCEDYNFSAPHGAGRILSRKQAKDSITLEAFKESMEGIYSTSVCENTIDESCFAYKGIDSILDNIKDTCEVVKIVKPIYNFKAHEEMEI